MLKLKHFLLAFSVIGLVIGFDPAQDCMLVYFGWPLAVILLGLYMIVHALEKESALMDKQMAEGAALRGQPPRQNPVAPRAFDKDLGAQRGTPAHSH